MIHIYSRKSGEYVGANDDDRLPTDPDDVVGPAPLDGHTDAFISKLGEDGKVSLGVRAVYIAARIAEAQAIGDQLLADLAKSWQYDDFLRLVTYVTSTIPQWAAEAKVAIAYRDQLWQAAHQYQIDHLMDGTEEGFRAALPKPPDRPQV